MRPVHVLWVLGVIAAGAVLVWLMLPDTVEYRFGDETALTGDADRGEWVDGWYWSTAAAAAFAERRLGPGATVRCTGAGDFVRSMVGDNRLYRRLRCPARFAAVPGRRFAASVRVENRNLATVFCRRCPADPAERGELLALANRFVELTHRALDYHDEHGAAAPAHVAQAERLQLVLERWSGRNADDAPYRALAETAAECAGLLIGLITAPEPERAATDAYNACIRRFGDRHNRLAAAFGPQPPPAGPPE